MFNKKQPKAPLSSFEPSLRPHYFASIIAYSPTHLLLAYDAGNTVVERILAHTGNLKKRKLMKFKVKWAGYEDVTWEEWKNVRLVDKLHDYLRANGMKALIPK